MEILQRSEKVHGNSQKRLYKDSPSLLQQVSDNLLRNCPSLSRKKPVLISPSSGDRSSDSLNSLPSVRASSVARSVVSHCSLTPERDCRHRGEYGGGRKLSSLTHFYIAREAPDSRGPPHSAAHNNSRPHTDTVSSQHQPGQQHQWRYEGVLNNLIFIFQI